MKSYWPCDLIFIILAFGIGFIFPWWNIFILSILWSYSLLASPAKIFLYVFLAFLTLILILGNNLLHVIEMKFVGEFANHLFFNYLLALLTAILFSTICMLFASLAKDLRLNINRSFKQP